MTTFDLTENMIPSKYGAADQWITADQFSLATPAISSPTDPDWAATWIELQMHCRYTRRVERFSVLYQGPGGTMRMEHAGPEVAGPIGCLVAQASVIASTPVARARYIEVKAGDVLVISGQRMAIVDDRAHHYPRLVTEAEAGALHARALIRARWYELTQPSNTEHEDTIDGRLQRAAQVKILHEAIESLDDLLPILREQYAAR
jgi:hypothetical protein